MGLIKFSMWRMVMADMIPMLLFNKTPYRTQKVKDQDATLLAFQLKDWMNPFGDEQLACNIYLRHEDVAGLFAIFQVRDMTNTDFTRTKAVDALTKADMADWLRALASTGDIEVDLSEPDPTIISLTMAIPYVLLENKSDPKFPINRDRLHDFIQAGCKWARGSLTTYNYVDGKLTNFHMPDFDFMPL